jgi:glycosyltransferase involved in cell wall biosynthesis
LCCYLRSVKILFIGDLNLGRDPQGGGQFKGRVLDSIYGNIENIQYKRIDTNGYKKNWVILGKIFSHLFLKKYHVIIISTATKSADRLFSIIAVLRPQLLNKVIYHPQGMYIEQAIVEGTYDNRKYRRMPVVYLESPRAVDVFVDKKISAKYFPNVKFFDLDKSYVRYKDANTNLWKFVFVSHIATAKGVFVILDALKRLEIDHPEVQIKMDFYGPIDELIKIEFESRINEMGNVDYCGYLNLMNDSDSCYSMLANYDLLVLPTFWKGEGIAGAFIDAFISGLPVLTTSWNVNEEVIKDNYNGWIVSPKNVDDLADKILIISKDINKLNEMKNNAFNSRIFHHHKVVEAKLNNDVQF